MVIRADDLLTWIDHGQVWQWGLRAATTTTNVRPSSGGGVASAEGSRGTTGDVGCGGDEMDEEEPNKKNDDDEHVPTLKNTQLDFSDVNMEKGERRYRPKCINF